MPPSIKITKDEINELPLVAHNGRVSLVDSNELLHQVLPDLEAEEVLGFDTESRPSFKKGQNFPVSLIQLSGKNCVWLFQIHKFDDHERLWKLLANPDIIKAGVAIQDDIKKLQELHDFEPEGFVEIATLTQQAGILNTGLRSLAGLLLNARISKRAQVSNWARPTLTNAQIQYACTDAWMSRRIYMHMLDLRARANGNNPQLAASQ